MEETRRNQKMRENGEEEAEVEMWEYIFGFTKMAAVKCAIELKIAEAIESHQTPLPLSHLSYALNCSPSALYRLMRFLVHHRIFREQPTSIASGDESGYVLTPLSRRLLLRGGDCNGMADLLLLESSTVMLAPWLHLSKRVLADGVPAFEEANGEDIWRYTEKNSEHSKLIDEAMACDTRMTVPAMVEGCPEVFEGVGTLVDVGGGNGTALRLLVEAFPSIKAINFDLPHVVSVAAECDGVDHVGGDMFKSVPKADATMLKWVLHDWNDEDCIKILRNCKEAIPKEKGKVIIVDAVVDHDTTRDDKLEFVRLTLDVVMMAHTHSGKERTSIEWEHVLRQAGFTRFSFKPIRAVQSVIEAFPS